MRRVPSPVRVNGHLFNGNAEADIATLVGRVLRPATSVRSRRKIAFGWYGGKFSHLDWLLPLLPKCHHYGEPFGGSAAVLVNRDPSPVETYNDLDGEVVNFFRVLREKKDTLGNSEKPTIFPDHKKNRMPRGRVCLDAAA